MSHCSSIKVMACSVKSLFVVLPVACGGQLVLLPMLFCGWGVSAFLVCGSGFCPITSISLSTPRFTMASAQRNILLSIRFMVVTTIWFGTKVKCCKGNTKTLYPSKKVYNLYTNICVLAVFPLVKECVCFYCHLTLFIRNKLIFRYFKSVR